MPDFNGYINKYGLVTMNNGDAGDGPMKTSFYYVGQYLSTTDTVYQAALRSSFDKVLANIQLPSGDYVRDPEKWNDPKDLSRDQTWPMIAACSILGLVARRDTLIDAVLGRFSQAQNHDIFGPDMWAAFIRFKRLWLLWPALWVCDIAILVNSVIQLFKGLNPDNVGDDNNHCLQILVAKMYWPTLVSWFARKLYVWARPYSYGSYLAWPDHDDAKAKADFNSDQHARTLITCSAVQGAWRWYWRPSTGAPPMADLWQPILKEF